MPAAAKASPKSKWKPAPPDLIRRFEDAVRDLSAVQLRKMFGYPAAFVNGNMLGGLFQDSLMLRLSEADRALARAEAGAEPFEPMPGRVMREYILVPDEILKSRARLKTWVGKACSYTRSLPAKAAKPSRKKPKNA